MNIYVVDAGKYEYTEVFDSELGGPQVEDYAIGIVAANSRGQAKSIFLRHDKDLLRSFDFTSPMRVLKLGIVESASPYFVEYDDPKSEKWWGLAHEKLGDWL